MTIAALAGLEIFLVIAVLLIVGVPIGVTLCVASIVVVTQSLGFDAAIPASAAKIFQGINIFTLLAIPFFILAGNIMASGGISRRLVNFCSTIVGKTNGGLAIVSIISCMFFGAVCGSAIATCAAVGAIMIPAMLQKGYDKHFTAATITTASITGMLIPPSVQLVVYCVMVGASVGKAFIAGIVPGVLFGLGCVLVAFLISKKHDYREERSFSLKEIAAAFWDAALALLMPVIILGGIFTGFFTATEAAVVAVVYGLVVGLFIYREIGVRELFQIFLNSAMASAGILLILGCANLLGMILTRAQVPAKLAEVFISVSSNKYIFLLMVNVLFLILGMFMEMTAITIVMTPLLLPVVKYYGIDLIHFGVLMTMNLGIGLLTPPFGIGLYLICDMSGAEFHKLLRSLIPYFIIAAIVLAMVTYIPDVSLFLTRFMAR